MRAGTFPDAAEQDHSRRAVRIPEGKAPRDCTVADLHGRALTRSGCQTWRGRKMDQPARASCCKLSLNDAPLPNSLISRFRLNIMPFCESGTGQWTPAKVDELGSRAQSLSITIRDLSARCQARLHERIPPAVYDAAVAQRQAVPWDRTLKFS